MRESAMKGAGGNDKRVRFAVMVSNADRIPSQSIYVDSAKAMLPVTEEERMDKSGRSEIETSALLAETHARAAMDIARSLKANIREKRTHSGLRSSSTSLENSMPTSPRPPGTGGCTVRITTEQNNNNHPGVDYGIQTAPLFGHAIAEEFVSKALSLDWLSGVLVPFIHPTSR
jgi:hypothetical protein